MRFENFLISLFKLRGNHTATNTAVIAYFFYVFIRAFPLKCDTGNSRTALLKSYNLYPIAALYNKVARCYLNANNAYPRILSSCLIRSLSGSSLSNRLGHHKCNCTCICIYIAIHKV